MPTNRPRQTDEPAALSLREFWEKLQRERMGGGCTPPAPAAPDAPASPSPAPSVSAPPLPADAPLYGSFRGSGGSSGSGSGGSGGGGYGLGLVVPDRFSRERILGIMKALCEKDAARNGKA